MVQQGVLHGWSVFYLMLQGGEKFARVEEVDEILTRVKAPPPRHFLLRHLSRDGRSKRKRRETEVLVAPGMGSSSGLSQKLRILYEDRVDSRAARRGSGKPMENCMQIAILFIATPNCRDTNNLIPQHRLLPQLGLIQHPLPLTQLLPVLLRMPTCSLLLLHLPHTLYEVLHRLRTRLVMQHASLAHDQHRLGQRFEAGHHRVKSQSERGRVKEHLSKKSPSA